MNQEQFRQLPHLVMLHHLNELGYGRPTVSKFVDCGVLVRVSPKGSGKARYQKRQVAALLKWEGLLDTSGFAQEKPMMDAKAVMRWTGWSDTTLANIARAGGLTLVKPPGAKKGKFQKSEIAALIGLATPPIT